MSRTVDLLFKTKRNKMNRITLNVLSAGVLLLLASCGAKRAVVNDAHRAQTQAQASADRSAMSKLAAVQRIYDNQVYAPNITGSMSFNIQGGDKDITVPGSVHLRKDEVIRLQLFIPIIGSEVGRLEFTPDYVLLIDRIHKEYIRADYSQLDFLRANGLNFYSLQALFWNQLLLPGAKSVGEEDLKRFDIDLDAPGTSLPVTLQKGLMRYRWDTDRGTGRITRATVHYASAAHGTSDLTWNYSDFRSVGVKMFPAKQSFRFTTTATKQRHTVQVAIEMNDVKTDSNWESRSKVSEKYKRVEAQDLLGKILNM